MPPGLRHLRALAAAVLPVLLLLAAVPATAAVSLSDSCPPGFLEQEDGNCRLVSLYEQFASFDGQGGLRTALPSGLDAPSM